MNKTWIIIKREYLSRVTKKTFILTTLLTPLLFTGMIAAVGFITVKNKRNEKIAVVDPSNLLRKGLESSKTLTYTYANDADTGNFVAKGFDALLLAPGTGINRDSSFSLITDGSLSNIAQNGIEKDIEHTLENNLISSELNVNPAQIDSIKTRAEAVGLKTTKLGESGKMEESNSGLAAGIGYLTAFLIYITLFIYGTMVLKGVMEEKTNRIAEVMVSSVKPFQLMLGKIIGIGAVGLTQFLMWIVLLVVLNVALAGFFPIPEPGSVPGGMASPPTGMAEALGKLNTSLATVNWGWVIGCFLFYFIGGYLFYAALFAAVGSAVNEDSSDAQSLSLPITMPIILAIVIMINAITDPSSSLATWSSIIPFFSPIVMMARVPFGVPDTVPYWQLGLSMLLLILGFLGTTWLSAKIYRTGILMYGKKPTLKELVQWARR